MGLKAKNSMAQHKLLLLYLLNTNPHRPEEQGGHDRLMLTELQIMRIMDELELMSYFDLKECLFELKENRDINAGATPQGMMYSITEKGSDIINVMLEELHLSSRNAVRDYLVQNNDELKKESQYISEYIKLRENEYRVTLKVLEQNSTIFEINVVVYSKQQAQHISEKWKDRAVDIYRDMMLKFS